MGRRKIPWQVRIDRAFGGVDWEWVPARRTRVVTLTLLTADERELHAYLSPVEARELASRLETQANQVEAMNIRGQKTGMDKL